ncbi:hypothetical protein M413DRAFT_240362 [Hebeloma cylindrosporum]|uniref:Uncharacterized protein n=1 Tax=Hebeloma cylindrosporum TaxID=76867 RepID=A0A0C2YCG9_HEBCY|nr:hypothetical protein M413DRAFT_240362 [Hebeloma cylindrosporum h7]
MNLKLKFALILAGVLVPCTFIFLVALMTRKSNRRKSRWVPASSYTVPPLNWAMLAAPAVSTATTTTATAAAPAATQNQAGDASDGAVTKFALDGRGESKSGAAGTVPPPAAVAAVTRGHIGGSSSGLPPPLKQSQSQQQHSSSLPPVEEGPLSTVSPIQMDGADR